MVSSSVSALHYTARPLVVSDSPFCTVWCEMDDPHFSSASVPRAYGMVFPCLARFPVCALTRARPLKQVRGLGALLSVAADPQGPDHRQHSKAGHLRGSDGVKPVPFHSLALAHKKQTRPNMTQRIAIYIHTLQVCVRRPLTFSRTGEGAEDVQHQGGCQKACDVLRRERRDQDSDQARDRESFSVLSLSRIHLCSECSLHVLSTCATDPAQSSCRYPQNFSLPGSCSRPTMS